MIHLLFLLLPVVWQQLIAPMLPSLTKSFSESVVRRVKPRSRGRAKRGTSLFAALNTPLGQGVKRVLSMSFVLLTLVALALPFWWDALNWKAIGLALAPRPTAGAACRVVKVTDGDSVRIWCPEGGEQPARVLGYDTPEIFSPKCTSEKIRGLAATEALRGMLARAQTVVVETKGRDKYGRTLVILRLDGEDVAKRMVGDGHARVYAGARREGWCG